MRRYYECEHLVTFEETNLVGNVYFARYLSWQGECRERFLADQAPGVIASLAGDLALVTLSCSCEFLSEVYALDRLSIRMSLGHVSFNTISMDFEYYRLGSGPAQLVARGQQSVACMRRDPGGLRPVAVPDELAAALVSYSDLAATGSAA